MLAIVLNFLLPASSWATPEYAEETRQGCKICHLEEEGGDLSETGIAFAASGYEWPPKGGYRVLGPIKKSVRLVIGAFHMIAAFIWFGTILYVHIILRPGYAARGLPKGEVLLGMISMAVVGITGILLTVSKINSFGILLETLWGLLLTAKIIFYAIMISSAMFVVFFVGPRLKKGLRKPVIPVNRIFDPSTLASFDGKEDRPAFIAYKGKAYDMTELKLWKNGIHMKHIAGNDLTEALAKAPHGEEKLEGLNVTGSYDSSLKPPKTFAQKAFYFIAYMNLSFVFCVLIIISYWRWGI